MKFLYIATQKISKNMNKILLALLLFPIAGFSQIFYEDFENGIPPTWTQQITGAGQWEASNYPFNFYNFDTTIAYFNDDALDEATHTPWAALLSPVIDLTPYSEVTLSFDYFNMILFENTEFSVWVYDGSNWEILLHAVGDHFIENEFTIALIPVQYDVTPYINPEFQIRFVYNDMGDWSVGAGIDNVLLEGTLSVGSSAKSELTLSPNPSTGIFTLSHLSGAAIITVNDLTGKTIREFAPADSYDVSDLTAGVYTITISDGANRTVKKLVLK